MSQRVTKLIDRLKCMNKPAKASIIFTLCSFLQKGMAFCMVPIYTRIMSAENYGYYSTFLSWMQIIAVFATLNLSYHVYTNGIMKYETDRDGYTTSMLGLSSLITILLFCIYLLRKEQWNELLNLPTVFVALMFAEILLQPSFEYWSSYQRFQFKYKALAILTVGIVFAIPVVTIPAVLLVPESQKGLMAIIGKVGVTIAAYMIPLCIILQKRKPLFNKEYWKFALKFNIPLVPHFLSAIILQQSDRIMISNLCGNTQVAMYSVAFSISTIMNIVNTSIMNSMIPWTYQSMKKRIILLSDRLQTAWLSWLRY